MSKVVPVFCLLGSSVTFGSATDGVSFVEEIARSLEARCVKNAVSGTTLAKVTDGTQSYVERLADFDTKAEVNTFIVQLSTNDATQNLPLGELSEIPDTFTVVGAIEYIIDYIQKHWKCEIVFYTNPCFHNAQYEKMIAVLYRIQQKRHIGIVDFYNYRDMPPIPSDVLSTYMTDDIHPNALGYKWMADILINYLVRKTGIKQ